MTDPRLIEALLEGAIGAGFCRDLRGCSPATGEVLPAQYLLLVRDRPCARAALRRAATGLLTLLDLADEAHASSDGCGKLRALAAAPDWLHKPVDPDDSDPDVALILECRICHEDDWHALLETLHRAGSVKWQWAIQRVRTLMAFEQATGSSLPELIGAPGPDRSRSEAE
jgi:hypothetical protein